MASAKTNTPPAQGSSPSNSPSPSEALRSSTQQQLDEWRKQQGHEVTSLSTWGRKLVDAAKAARETYEREHPKQK